VRSLVCPSNSRALEYRTDFIVLALATYLIILKRIGLKAILLATKRHVRGDVLWQRTTTMCAEIDNLDESRSSGAINGGAWCVIDKTLRCVGTFTLFCLLNMHISTST
jgi:hypothetical protein